jgi:hypothetical protein
VELTLLEGSSKGHEQLASFHSVRFPLEVEEVRVLVTRCSILQPESPMVAVGSAFVSGAFRNSKITAEGSQVSRSQAGSWARKAGGEGTS